MKNEKRVALTKALTRMEEPAATVLYAIDIVMEGDAFEYSFSAHTEALKLIKRARKQLHDT